ncbi:hypothetical protein MNV49_001959 [Pseudohyphozyma bogoriensis]|nr:hypothetical protein MNV49_001959 [Pseudohyphozyma bogoriensis]
MLGHRYFPPPLALALVVLLATLVYLFAAPTPEALLEARLGDPTFVDADFATRYEIIKAEFRGMLERGKGEKELTWRRRDELASLLCRASLGATPCVFTTGTSGPEALQSTNTSVLGYELAPPSLKHSITAVLPVDVASVPLLTTLCLSLTLQNPLLSTIFDSIWIVAPTQADAETIFEALVAANALPLVARVLSHDVLLSSTHRSTRGWFAQQEVKLAMAVAVRTDYYLTLDADVMAGRTLSWDDFIDDATGKGFIASTKAGGFWGWESGNLARTCATLGVSCEEYTGKSVVTAFTPVLFHSHGVFSLLGELEEKARQRKKGAGWVEYLEEVQLSAEGSATQWTEYLLYMVHARSRNFYFDLHIPTFHTNTYVEEGTGAIPAFFAKKAKDRSAWINVNDNRGDIKPLVVRKEVLIGILGSLSGAEGEKGKVEGKEVEGGLTVE